MFIMIETRIIITSNYSFIFEVLILLVFNKTSLQDIFLHLEQATPGVSLLRRPSQEIHRCTVSHLDQRRHPRHLRMDEWQRPPLWCQQEGRQQRRKGQNWFSIFRLSERTRPSRRLGQGSRWLMVLSYE